MYRETTIVVTAGTESEAGTVWRCLEYCWEVFLTKLIKQLPCCFWNFWLSAVRTTSKTTTLALDGNTFVNFHISNLSSQEKHALALKSAGMHLVHSLSGAKHGMWGPGMPKHCLYRREVGGFTAGIWEVFRSCVKSSNPKSKAAS